jgi:hypothetical protein
MFIDVPVPILVHAYLYYYGDWLRVRKLPIQCPRISWNWGIDNRAYISQPPETSRQAPVM